MSPFLTAGRPLDLYGVHAGREALLARAEHPHFSEWWGRFTQGCRAQLDEQAWPDADDSPEARHARAQAVATRMEAIALAAALTGDDDLGRRAAAMLRAVAEDPAPWMGPEHHKHYPDLNADLLTAERCKRLAATYSWARAWLSAEDRRSALSALRERGGGVIFADVQRGAWWADGHNSNWCAVLNSGLGLAALAVGEEDAATASAWLERAREAVRRILDMASEEGAGVVGIGYWLYCFRSSPDLAQALASCGDGALLAHPFWRRAVEFPLHFSMPDLSGWANFGDCGYPGLSGSPLFYAIAAVTGDRRAQWLANRIAGERPAERLTYWDLLACDPALPEEPPDNLPACRLFSSVHLCSLRSDWSRDAVWLALKGGSNAWSHCHLDLNSFIISAFGERLAIDPGPWPYTKDYWTSVEPPVSTAWHNTLVVDGADQRQPPRFRMSYDPVEAGDAYGLLDGFADTSWAALVRGDATTAYADTLDHFRRYVVYLKPDTFLIFDDVRVREARTQRHLQWLLHSEWPMEETAAGLHVRGEKAELHVLPLLPRQRASKFLPDRPSHGKGAAHAPVHCWALRPQWHHIWNVVPDRSPYPHWHPKGGPCLFGPDYPFMVLLQATRRGEAPRWQGEALGREGVGGAWLRAGDTEALAVFNPAGATCTVRDNVFAASAGRTAGLCGKNTVQTDAEQLVMRFRNGKRLDWIALNARNLQHAGETLLASPQRQERATGTFSV